MLVKHLAEELRRFVGEHSQAEGFFVGVAKYPKDGETTVRPIGSYNWDEDREFFLVPNGLSEAFKLKDEKITVGAFLAFVDAHTELHEYVAYVRERVKRLADGGVVSLNSPLSGTGIFKNAHFLSFFYGSPPP